MIILFSFPNENVGQVHSCTLHFLLRNKVKSDYFRVLNSWYGWKVIKISPKLYGLDVLKAQSGVPSQTYFERCSNETERPLAQKAMDQSSLLHAPGLIIYLDY